MPKLPSIMLALGGLLCTACANGAGGAPPAPALPAGLPPRLDSVADAVAAARADAARRRSVDAAAFEIVSAERVTWPDGSIGCPQPGIMYTMALVPGFRVRLRHQNDVLDYHASARGALVLCPAGQSANPVPGGTM
jgi:hypothetical protein